MQSISSLCALLSQKPGFLCGTRGGWAGGSGSIIHCDAEALWLLRQLPQHQHSAARDLVPMSGADLLGQWPTPTMCQKGQAGKHWDRPAAGCLRGRHVSEPMLHCPPTFGPLISRFLPMGLLCGKCKLHLRFLHLPLVT